MWVGAPSLRPLPALRASSGPRATLAFALAGALCAGTAQAQGEAQAQAQARGETQVQGEAQAAPARSASGSGTPARRSGPRVLEFGRGATAPAAPPAPSDRASITFIGTATVLLQWAGMNLLTDPNFLHKGERALLGYGLRTPRLTDPALPMEALPPLDAVLLSHYHGDHFDQVVEQRLDKRMPIVTTAHAAAQLRERGFEATEALRTWEAIVLRKGDARLRITSMPGRHGPPIAGRALPPVMGSLLEFLPPGASEPAYRLYISGDTLLIDELKDIPQRYPAIDMALLHLGGTRIFGVLVTMDAAQGVKALQLLQPRTAVPIHYDDYPVFKSPLSDFVQAVRRAGLQERVRYLQRGERHDFDINPGETRR